MTLPPRKPPLMTPQIGKHLATFNLFREADHSLHVTIAEAQGVAEELGGSGAPLYLCAMNALRAAEEIRAPEAPPLPQDVALLTKVRESIVLAIAFLGRDHGSDRAERTVPEVIAELAMADNAILAALSQQPASVDVLGEALAALRTCQNAILRQVDFHTATEEAGRVMYRIRCLLPASNPESFAHKDDQPAQVQPGGEGSR